MLGELLGEIIQIRPARALSCSSASRSTRCSTSETTSSRWLPPLIDYVRTERIAKEAEDPETAVILLDVVLGFGSHVDPSSELVPAINRARTTASAQGRTIVFVGQICGTAGDPQDFARQARALSDAGVLLAESNAQAVRLAAGVASTLAR